MHIEPVRINNYKKHDTSEKQSHRNLNKRGLSRPLDVVIIDEMRRDKNNLNSNHASLHRFIDQMSDEQVREKIKNLRNGYDSIDDFLIDKLIIEEL